MRPELMAELGSCCAGLGIGLQYLRAFQRIPDEFTVTLGIVCALGLWALGFDWSIAKDWQASIVHSLPIVFTFISSLLGGMYGTEKSAAFVASKGISPAHPLLPVTDSK